MIKNIKDKMQNLLGLHVAGATVRHQGQFSDLTIIENTEPLSKEFIEKYVQPFYLGRKDSGEFKEKYREIRHSLDIDVISKLLGEFNWRPRSVGAYFTALEGINTLEENIGHLLLRSDTCYSGHNYCLTLASFASAEAIHYLNQYLDYYLKQKDLYFDQSSAMAALSFIGQQQGKDLLTAHMPAWETFVAEKDNWDLQQSIDGFSQQMDFLNEFRRELHKN